MSEEQELQTSPREEKALLNFKNAVEQLLLMLRKAMGADTAYMYWINESRGQFVLESSDTELQDVAFEDRVAFENHFLLDWKDLTEPQMLEVGTSVLNSDLRHHVRSNAVRNLFVLPFVNSDQTVAIITLEFRLRTPVNNDRKRIARAFHSSLHNILSTYLDLSSLIQEESRWIDFEQRLTGFSDRLSLYNLLHHILKNCAELLPNGGALLVSFGMNGWHSVLGESVGGEHLPLGMQASEQSQAGQALKLGKPQFSPHFNANPKILNTAEPRIEGASLAIPLDIHDRRQGVLMAWDKDPNTFRESVKHMLQTLVRMGGLQLSSAQYAIAQDAPFLIAECGAYTRELLEHMLSSQIKQAERNAEMQNAWLYFISPEDYQRLRTRYPLERLKRLQQKMAVDLNPNRSGLSGLVCFYTESLFIVYVEAEEEKMVQRWLMKFDETAKEKAKTGTSYIEGVDFIVGKHGIVWEEAPDAHELIRQAKHALNKSVKENITLSKLIQQK